MNQLKKHIYFISGLGADRQAFSRLKFDSNYVLYYIEWIEPKPYETFSTYCLRLAEQIHERENCMLVGLSFGGMVAQEISKSIIFEKIILISTIKSRLELPLYFRLIGKLGLHHFLPDFLLKQNSVLLRWFFGVKSEDVKAILKSFISNANPRFLKWAIHIILTENFSFPKHVRLLHLHGDADRLLPIRFVSNGTHIVGGGHLMVYENYEEVNAFMQRFLNADLV